MSRGPDDERAELIHAIADAVAERLPDFQESLAEAAAGTRSAVTTSTAEIARHLDALATWAEESLAALTPATDPTIGPRLDRLTESVLDAFTHIDDLRTLLAPGPLLREVRDLRADLVRLASVVTALQDDLAAAVRVSVNSEVEGLLSLFKSELDERYQEAATDREAFRRELQDLVAASAASEVAAELASMREEMRRLRRRMALRARPEDPEVPSS